MLEARENVHHQVVIRFSLVSGWLRSSRYFPNQSQSKAKENQCKPELLAIFNQKHAWRTVNNEKVVTKTGNKKWRITSRKVKWEIEIGKGIFFDINCLQCGINVFSDNYRYSFLLAFTAKRKWQKKKEVTQSVHLLIARIFLRLYGEKRNSQNIHRITC